MIVNDGLCKCSECGQIQDQALRFACKTCGSAALKSIRKEIIGANKNG